MLIQKIHDLEDKQREQKQTQANASYLKWSRLTRQELSEMIDLSVHLRVIESKQIHSK